MSSATAAADADADFVVVGRVTGVFGIKGWVKIASFTEPQGNLLDYHPWYLETPDGHGAEIEVDEVAARNKGYMARLAGCNDRNEAETLVGRDISVPRAALPGTAEDEYYWSDLIGRRVVLHDGLELGRVSRMLATGANDVMVISGEDRERLIPFTAQVVSKVDVHGDLITVDWDPEF